MKQLGDVLSSVGGVQPSGAFSWRAKVAITILGAFLLGVPWARSMPKWVLAISGVIVIAAIVALWVNQIAQFFQDQSKIEEKTTSELREDVAEGLRETDRPLVVLIDDVDRLTIEEVELLFQLVRSSASFPNVVYVMGLDVNRIREELEHKETDEGYLDKIIQEIYDLPEIPEGRIEEYAETRILSEEVLGRDTIRRFSTSNQRWSAVFSAATDAYFNTLRDVNRFLSSLRLQIGRFIQNDRFEANAVDLFAIHVLRVFEHPIFQSLVEHKQLLCRAPGQIAHIDEVIDHVEKQEGKEAPSRPRGKHLDQLVGQAKDEQAVSNILASLFPYASKYLLEDKRVGNRDHTSWLLQRRIAHPFYFRSYFEQRPAKHPLSREEEEDLRDLLRDPKDLQDQLREWERSNRLVEGLHFLRSYVYEVALEKHEHKKIVQAFHFEQWLVNRSQSIEAKGKLALLREPNTPYEVARDTISKILRQTESDSETADLIRSLLDSPPALRFARSALQLIQEKHLLSNEALERLQKEYARKVQRKMEHGANYDRGDFAENIVLWFKWGNVKGATDWLEEHIEKGDLYSIARRFKTEEDGFEKNTNKEVRFRRELIELLDGTRSVRDLREKALESISTALSEKKNGSTWTDRQELLNALKERLMDSLDVSSK